MKLSKGAAALALTIPLVLGVTAGISNGAPNTGVRKVMVLRVRAADDTTASATRWDTAQATTVFNKLHDMFAATSYGKLDLSFQITDQYALPGNENDYRTGDLSSDTEWDKTFTDAVANAPGGLDWDNLAALVILFKDDTTPGFHRGLGTSACTFKKGPGSGTNVTAGCVMSWENKTETEERAWGRIGHELGHAFQQAGPAHPSNYDNRFELMDNNLPGHTGPFEKQATQGFPNWLPESQYQNVVPNVGGSAPSWAPAGSAVGGGGFDLRAVEYDPTTEPTLQALRIYTSSASRYLMLSVRRRVLGDELSPIPSEGVIVERVTEGGNTSVSGNPWVEVIGPGGSKTTLWDGSTGKSSLFDSGVSIGIVKRDDDHYTIKVGYDLAVRPDVAVTAWRSAPNYRWETQDIWVDSPVNGYGTYRYGTTTSTYGDTVPNGNGDDPAVGQANRLYARVRNLGTQDATNVTVHIDRTDPEGRGINGSNGFMNVGTVVIPFIAAGSFADGYVDYTPSFTPTPAQIAAGSFGFHTCLRVRIDTVPNEVVLGNQDGDGEQENIDTFQVVAGPGPGAPAEYNEVIHLRNDDNVNKKSFRLSYTSDAPADWTVDVNNDKLVVELAPGELRDIPIVLKPATQPDAATPRAAARRDNVSWRSDRRSTRHETVEACVQGNAANRRQRANIHHRFRAAHWAFPR
jgi:M6 family metalloprotease-like protein